MDPLLAYRAALIERAERVVDELAEAIAAIPAERWHTPLAEGERSPHEIMAHLRDVEAQAYAARLRRILDEDSPTLPALDCGVWRRADSDKNESMERLLSDYARLREEELARMRRMTPEQWSRTGRHDVVGVRTAQWWVERAVAHADGHLRQLKRRA